MSYTNGLDKPTDYFNTVLYTGNNTYPRTIDGFGFQPDFVWAKPRSVAYGHMLFDVIRGVGNTNFLDTRLSDAEGTSSLNANIDSFDSDGYIIDSPSSTDTQNASGLTMASWGWKAGGTGVSNTDGSITSTVSANTTSGFSIVSYTSNGSASQTVGHGLGVAPNVIISKNRTDGGATYGNWIVYHSSLATANDKKTLLNSTAATSTTNEWGDTDPTSTVYSVHTSGNGATNHSTDQIVSYCFAEKKGFSKFGSFTGNGSTDGSYIYLGFKPAWVMIKKYDNTSSAHWLIKDSTRDPTNVNTNYLAANLTNADATGVLTDFLSNGFKQRSTNDINNDSGQKYIYIAFAESPFTTSTGIPTTAR